MASLPLGTRWEGAAEGQWSPCASGDDLVRVVLEACFPRPPFCDIYPPRRRGIKRQLRVTLPRLSLCPLTIIRASPREMVQAAAVGGFNAVGLRLIAPRPGDPVHPLGRSEDLR